MPATFIAVQCFQCCTMQVKQQKKSSNRWVCVVCNQKQSVRKVFAQSSMARDVRKVVQSFNMARQLSDQRGSFSEEPDPSDPQSDDEQRKSMRNDWSEYVDDRDELEGNFGDATEGGDNGVEAMVLTEMPEPLFKKPKLKDYSSSGYGSEKMFRPVFPNRNAKRHPIDFSQETQSTEFEQMSCEIASKKSDSDNCAPKWKQMEEKFVWPSTKGDKGSVSESKWSSFITKEDDYDSLGSGWAREKPMKGDKGSISKSTDCIAGGSETNNLQHKTVAAAKGSVSKWSSFITEEDDYDGLGSGQARDLLGRVSQQMGLYPMETLVNDDKVDEDVHPDFL